MTLADLPSLGPGPGFWIVCAALGAMAGTIWTCIKVFTWFLSLVVRWLSGIFVTNEKYQQNERRISALETTTPAVFMEQVRKLNTNLEELTRRMDEDHRRRKHG